MKREEIFMEIAIKEAKKGIGKVNPNPLVGALIVKDNEIVATGYHEYYGGRHAEIVAIENAKKNGIDIKGATMYVTLEPCIHYGKTPPCVDRIIREGFSSLYIGMLDPNPVVCGKGVEKLRSHGISVKYGILEEKIKELNKVFIKYITTKIPFIAIKLALTLDGFMATKTYDAKWISNEKSREFTHHLRTFYTSILIGSGTLINDNPRLTARTNRGRNPIRVILDRRGKSLGKNLKIFKEKGKNIIFTDINFSGEVFYLPQILGKNIIFTDINPSSTPLNTEIINETDPKKILKILGDKGIDSVLVEGGANVASMFLKYDLIDELNIFYAPIVIGEGLSPFGGLSIPYIKEALRFKSVKTKTFGDNVYWVLKRCLQE